MIFSENIPNGITILEVKLKKTALSCAMALLLTAASWAIETPYFSGCAGFMATLANETDSDDFSPEFNADNFFSGQLDFSGKVLLRCDLYLQAGNLFDSTIFDNDANPNNAKFRIEELSGTYTINGESTNHYISLFRGRYEPIGSDIFLQRQFGIPEISSLITKSWHGLSGSSIYPFYATGISYVMHPDSNFAVGLYVYKNEATTSLDSFESQDSFNWDFRYAAVMRRASLDLAAGFTCPLNNDTTDAFAIKEIQLHWGINALLGNVNTTTVFIQAGINKITIDKDDDTDTLNKNDLYFVIEPRLITKYGNINIAVFNIPYLSARDMIYLRHLVNMNNPDAKCVTGANITLCSNNLYIGSTNFTGGVHATFTISECDFDDFDFSDEKDFCITPYANLDMFGGALEASATINVTKLDDIKNAISARVGFQTAF